MKNLYCLILGLLITSFCYGQASFKYKEIKAPLAKKVYPMELEDMFFETLIYSEAPRPYETAIERVKSESKARFPRKPSQAVNLRRMVEPPVVEFGFEANSRDTSVPTDNSFGIAYDGTNVSAINTNLRFSDEEGNFIRSFPLNTFASGLAGGASMFDPRVIYDPQADRFCMSWLAGNNSETSTIIFAFASSSDVREPWHLYETDGSPFGPGRWSDYPMLSLTDDKLILTVNLIRDAEPWETGFDQTLVYQLDKAGAYEGTDNLDMTMFYDINFGGKAIRNLHPVKSADEELESEQYFLSNRNFDVINDTIFIVRMEAGATQNEDIEIDFRIADRAYGMPPNGQQAAGGELSTNDGRILDAFRLGDKIQFVSNSIDTATGSAAIYHGYIDNLETEKNVTASIVPHPTRDVAYPGIAWTGIEQSEEDAIIVAEHSSVTDFAGFSAIYVSPEREYSEWVDVKTGGNYVDMLNGTERWGDYIGCQRNYDVPGEVWVSSMFTKNSNRMHTWVAKLSEPNRQMSSTAEAPRQPATVEVSPNPTSERVRIKVDIPRKEALNIALYDIEGKLRKQFHQHTAKKVGELEFSFDMEPLTSGTYILKVVLGDKEVVSKKIIKT